MEIEFRERPMQCLREQAVDVLYQEETAELIVPDSYPDVQAIADSSAICCLRDQEVLSGSMTASGAFQASVLYTAEGDGAVCALDAYLPFTAKLAREEIGPDSAGMAELRIRAVDARILNSRKILVRVSYAVRLTAYGKEQLPLWDTDAGEPVQLLRVRETGTFPVEAAEKLATFSESIELPAGEIRKIVKIAPEIQLNERSIVESRAVVKGNVALHLVYLLENGQLGSFDVQLPVSQYLELEQDAAGGTLRTAASFTDFQLEPEESGGYLVTVGLRLQAVVWKQLELPVIADGYCPGRGFEADYESYRIRQSLDEPSMTKNAEGTLRGAIRKLVDCTAWVDFPVCRRSEDEITVGTAVTIHALYYDDEDRLCGETVKTEESGSFALSEGAACYADTDQSGSCFTSMSGDGTLVSCPIAISARCFAERELQGMRSASVGEPLQTAADRPSLIVRRTNGESSLWSIAKDCGATVQAIRDANGLGEETPEGGQLLLIPMV